MPLIDITMKPGYVMRRTDGSYGDEGSTRLKIKRQLAEQLPALLVANADDLGLEPGTPAEAVQVMNHDYGEYDVNVANIWIKVQFSEDTPDESERHLIREVLYGILLDWLIQNGIASEGLVMDLFWGPTNGRGTVNGVEIVW